MNQRGQRGHLSAPREVVLELAPQTVRPDADAERVWKAILAEINNDTIALECYLGHLQAIGVDGRQLVVVGPRGLSTWVRRKYGAWLSARAVERGYPGGVLVCDQPQGQRGRP